jgi:hypothetical protein
MGKGELHDYVFDVIQEEECLIWDTAVTNPMKWLDEYCDYEEEMSWMSRMVGKMLDTYKE